MLFLFFISISYIVNKKTQRKIMKDRKDRDSYETIDQSNRKKLVHSGTPITWLPYYNKALAFVCELEIENMPKELFYSLIRRMDLVIHYAEKKSDEGSSGMLNLISELEIEGIPSELFHSPIRCMDEERSRSASPEPYTAEQIAASPAKMRLLNTPVDEEINADQYLKDITNQETQNSDFFQK